MNPKKVLKTKLLIINVAFASILLSGFKISDQQFAYRKSCSFKPDTNTVRNDISNVEKILSASVKKGDNQSAANCYTLDAKLMLPNFPAIAGRKNIASIYLAANQAGEGSLDYNTVSIWNDSTIITEEGTYVLGSKEGKQLDKGKYITLWKKEDGKLKMFRTCLNSDLPVAGVK